MGLPRYVSIVKMSAICILSATVALCLPLGKTPVDPATDILRQRDPLLSINASPDFSSGQLAYMVNVLPIGPRRPITYDLVLRGTGGKIGGGDSFIYRLVTDDENLLFDMNWSPDGSNLLLKEGDRYNDTSKYRLYFWNSHQKLIEAGPEQYLSNPTVNWSLSNRFISYVQGGDTNGFETRDVGPLRLYSYNLQKHRSYFLVQNPAVGSNAWTKQETLLCTLLSPFDTSHPTPDAQRQSIYEFPVEGGKRVKIIDHGSDPVPSPNGRWIVFYGWPDLKAQADRQEKSSANQRVHSYLPGTYLFDRLTGKRVLLREAKPNTFHDNIAWSPDSKTIYVVWNDYKSNSPLFMSTADQKVYSGQGTGHVYVIHLPQVTKHEVATLSAFDINSRIDTTGQFLIKGISTDGSQMFLQVSRIGDKLSAPPYYDYLLEMDAIGLQSKKRQVIWTTRNAEAIDWHLRQ